MAFPTVVVGPSDFIACGYAGPFVIGANLYTILVRLSTLQITVWKSTDNGNTWTEQDTIHSPVAGNMTGDDWITSVTDGTNFYVFYSAVNSGSASWSVSKYSTVSDTWISTSVSIITWTSPNQNYIGAFYRPSNGTIVVLYADSTGLGTAWQTKYFIFTVGTNSFSAAVNCGENTASDVTNGFGVVPGNGTDLLLVYIGVDQTVSGNSFVKYQTLSIGNVLGALTLIDTIPMVGFQWPGSNFAEVSAYSDGTNVLIALAPQNHQGMMYTYKATTAALVFTRQIVNLGVTATVNGVSALVSGGSLFAFASTTTDNAHFPVNLVIDTGAGFGASTLLFTPGGAGGFNFDAGNQAVISSAPTTANNWDIIVNGSTTSGVNFSVFFDPSSGVGPAASVRMQMLAPGSVLLPDSRATHLCRFAQPPRCKSRGTYMVLIK